MFFILIFFFALGDNDKELWSQSCTRVLARVNPGDHFRYLLFSEAWCR